MQAINTPQSSYAQRNVPRYTSYPTAASFTNAVSAAEQQAWLQTLPPRSTVSIYLHVPYCKDICHYCGCNTKASRRADIVAQYQAALTAEIERVGDLIEQPLRVGRIHWGGGTPSILGGDGIGAVLGALKRHFSFEVLREHAIELDPRLVTRDLALALRALGIDRASLGVQDIDPAVQAAIGRMQPLATVERATEHLRDAGVSQINFDLIYGLPLQTTTSLAATCEAVLSLMPDRVAFYGYAHVPALRANQRLIDSNTLPDTEERLAQIHTICAAMERRGYAKIGIDHFARPDDPLTQAARSGRLRRNFQGYTDDPENVLLGFGASSISRFPQGYVQNINDPRRYVAAIEAGLLPSARGICLDSQDWMRARVIERLMCDFRVDLSSTAPDMPVDDVRRTLEPLIGEGLVQFADGVISATAAGRPLIRVIASAFDTYSQLSFQTFSQAV